MSEAGKGIPIPEIITLIRAGFEIIGAFTKEHGRGPTDEELAALAVERNRVEVEYLRELAAFRARH